MWERGQARKPLRHMFMRLYIIEHRTLCRPCLRRTYPSKKWRTCLRKGFTIELGINVALFTSRVRRKGGGDNMTNEFGRLRNIANIGDIVTVEGYEGSEFQVEAYTHEIDYQPGYKAETILYDLTDITTFKFLLAFQDDISVKVRADKADEYLKSAPKKNEAPPIFDPEPSALDVWYPQGIIDKMANLKDVDTSEKNRTVDELLDEMRDWPELVEMFGEDAWYRENIERIKEQLRGGYEK